MTRSCTGRAVTHTHMTAVCTYDELSLTAVYLRHDLQLPEVQEGRRAKAGRRLTSFPLALHACSSVGPSCDSESDAPPSCLVALCELRHQTQKGLQFCLTLTGAPGQECGSRPLAATLSKELASKALPPATMHAAARIIQGTSTLLPKARCCPPDLQHWLGAYLSPSPPACMHRWADGMGKHRWARTHLHWTFVDVLLHVRAPSRCIPFSHVRVAESDCLPLLQRPGSKPKEE